MAVQEPERPCLGGAYISALCGHLCVLWNKMEYLKVKNWEQYQHYKQRNPPWIKLYHSLLDDYNYSCLPDASKLLYVSILLLASRTNNKIPNDLEWIQRKAMLTNIPDIEPLFTHGFLTTNGDASNVLASCQQNADSETETETETETEKAPSKRTD